MISFANPAWLWGLTGLLIPIGIHLLSRKQGKVIYIGSIRHLHDSETAQFSSIRLNEILLLILRMIIITIAVFLLAGFSIDFNSGAKTKWLLIEKGIESEKDVAPLIDSLEKNEFQLHYLANGFPELSDSASVSKTHYWKLLEDLEKEGIDSVVVLSYNFMTNFAGEKTSLPQNVKWLTFEQPEHTFPLAATISQDTLIVRSGITSANHTSFESRKFRRTSSEKFFRLTSSEDSVEIRKADSVVVQIFSDPEFEYDLKIMQASLRAIDLGMPQKIIVKTFKLNEAGQNTNADFTIWLSKKTPSKINSTMIGFADCGNEDLPVLVRSELYKYLCSTSPDYSWIITRHLNEEISLQENFTVALASVITQGMKTKMADFKDLRAMPEQQAWASSEKHIGTKIQEQSASINNILGILLLLIVGIERWIAFRKNQ